MTVAPDDTESDADRSVAPGVVAVPVTIEGSELRHVFVYVLDCGTGVLLVDAGWGGEASLARIATALQSMGYGFGDVRGVLVTHNHSDHYGLVPRLAEEIDGFVGMHPADIAQLELRYGGIERLAGVLRDWLVDCGTPEDLLEALSSAMMWADGSVSPVLPDRHIADGDEIRVGERTLRAIHTPGHSPGHLVFHDAANGLLFTGDHVLPKITPNVSAGPLGSADPLDSYVASLDAVRRYDGARVLPAHVAQFDRLAERVDQLTAHHERRLAETAALVDDGASTVWEVATRLRWSRPLDHFPAFLQRAALGETDAHLSRLAAQGRVSRRPGTPSRWSGSGASA